MEDRLEERRRRLARLLRAIRKERDVTQVEMARRLSVSQSIVSKYEAGDRELGFLEIEAICHELGVSLRTFIRRWRSVATGSTE